MNAAWQEKLGPLKIWWEGLAARERRLVVAAGLVVAVFLLYTIALRPALRTLAAAPAQLDALDGQLQSMQRMAAEAKDLRAAPPVNAGQSQAALKAASDRLGTKARLTLQGDRATLTLNGVGTAQLSAWLAEVRSGARARPVEANLSRGASGYNGTIVVTIGGAT